jgi:Predicted membrane protein
MSAAEPAPASPADASARPTERPHPLTPLIRGWVVLLAILIAIGKEFLPDGSDNGFRVPPIELIVGGVALATLAAGLAGFVSWRFTRFVADAEELRIDSGVLLRQSQRIAYDKVQGVDVVQPFAARLFGLAEVSIDIGSGARPKLRFLTVARAHGMRDYLLARAHGDHRAEVTTHAGPASILTGLSVDDQVLVRLRTSTLVLAVVTSAEFIGAALLMIVAISVSAAFGHPWLSLGTAIPLGGALFGIVSRRVLAQINYSLSRRSSGLRITRGLTTLSSHSLPARKVQAIQVSQSLLWRRLGLYRVDLEVIGFGISDEQDSDKVSSIMLPAGDLDQVRICVESIWPGSGWEQLADREVPRRARRLHPLAGPFLRWGHDGRFVVTRHGWLVRRWQVVPLARAQSLSVVQGPISRRLGLADLRIQTGGHQLLVTAEGLDEAALTAEIPELCRLQRSRSEVDPTLAAGGPTSAVWRTAQAGPDALRADQAEDTISASE